MTQVSSATCDVLVCIETATLAHVTRSLTLAASLAGTYRTAVAFDRHFDSLIGELPGERHSLSSRAPADFQAILKKGGVIFDAEILRRYVREELELFARLRPRLVMGDMRPSLAVSCRVAGIPYMLVSNAYWSPEAARGAIPFPCVLPLAKLGCTGAIGRAAVGALTAVQRPFVSGILAAQGAGIDEVRKEHGFDPYPGYLDGFVDSDLTFFCDAGEVVPLSKSARRHVLGGPVIWNPDVPVPPEYGGIPDGDEVIYVSLGSSGPQYLLPAIVDALARKGRTVVVSRGALRDAWRDTPGVVSAPLLPGSEVCKRAALVVTNGGSPSVYQALMEGAPVIGIPLNMDQLLMMRHVERAGAGATLRADIFSGRALASLVDRTLRDGSMRERAKQLRGALAGYSAADAVRRAAEALLDGGARDGEGGSPSPEQSSKER